MPKFGRKEFQYFYDACFSEHERGMEGEARFMLITDDGVFYDARLRGIDPLGILSWKYVHELAGPNKPSSSEPALPFPATPGQLAAFMLWGWGNYFQVAFGRLDSGPNESVLNGDYGDAADAYEMLRQAYDAYRDAVAVVGEFDRKKQQLADDLWRQWNDANDQSFRHEKPMERLVIGKNKDGGPIFGDWIAIDERLARAREAVAAQKAQALSVKNDAKAEWKTWLRAVVRQLLQPQTTPASPAPVVAQSATNDTAPADTQEQVVKPDAAQAPPQGANHKTRTQLQDDEILSMLKSKGFDPLKIPKKEKGKPHVKTQIREALGYRGMWQGTVFNKAWDRLSQRKDIAYRQ